MNQRSGKKLCAASALTLTALLAVAGCGGGGDSAATPPPPVASTPTPTPAPSPTVSPTPPPAGNVANGKALYDTRCMNCHTSGTGPDIRILKGAGDPNFILSALGRNSMRMLGLRSDQGGPIGPTQAADIAAFLASP